MTLATRKPTGKAPWPIMLIAGVEKAGKSYACAEATGNAGLDRTFWVGIGEDDPDELGSLPGADFEIVQHDGTYRGILAAIKDAVAEPGTNLIVVDSMTKLWDLLSNMAQSEANQRAARKNRGGDGEARIDMDLWNAAKKRHQAVVNTLKDNRGPVLLTARLDNQVLMDDNGQPTKHRDWKIKCEKNLPYDVSAIIELHERGKAFITGVRSLQFRGDPSLKAPLPDFTVTALWERLRVTDSGPRHFDRNDGSEPAPDEPQPVVMSQPEGKRKPPTAAQLMASAERDWAHEIESATTKVELRALWLEVPAEWRDAVTVAVAALDSEAKPEGEQ